MGCKMKATHSAQKDEHVCVCLDMFCVFVSACARVDAYIIYTADTASRTEER